VASSDLAVVTVGCVACTCCNECGCGEAGDRQSFDLEGDLRATYLTSTPQSWIGV
jgi:hypothetical protein